MIYPERYQDEVERLRRAGIRFDRHEAAFQAGRLQLTLFPVVQGEEMRLIAVFPALYPWFRFEIAAPELELPRHQHAIAKTLCFLPRDTWYWHPGSDRLATFLTERLGQVLATGGHDGGPTTADPVGRPQEPMEGGDAAAARTARRAGVLEDDQAEPFSDYLIYHGGTAVMFDGTWRIPAERTHGTLIVGLPAVGRSDPLVRGVVLRVLDERGDPIVVLDEALGKPYRVELRVPWVRLDTPPVSEKAEPVYVGLRDVLRRVDPRPAEPQGLSVRGGTIRMRAGLFEEEHRPRSAGADRFGDGWVLAVRFEQDAPQAPRPKGGRGRRRQSGKAARPSVNYYLARATRAGRSDLAARIPELGRLARKRVAILGLGCLGAPSALELARAGIGELRLLDDDFVDPAATVRWPFGIGAAGLSKANVLEQLIQGNYPYTTVHTEVRRLGAVHRVSAEEIARGKIPEDDQVVLTRMLDGVDLVYDATAEEGVQYFLAAEARARGLPYIGVSGTQGGWGGVVVRLRPGETEGCWICYRHQCMTNIPAPPAFGAGRVQPTGCGNPTFTGSNFDLAEVALMGVRMAVATLAAGANAEVGSAYPVASWDVAILALRDSFGALIPPTWHTYPLPRHPDCEGCSTGR